MEEDSNSILQRLGLVPNVGTRMLNMSKVGMSMTFYAQPVDQPASVHLDGLDRRIEEYDKQITNTVLGSFKSRTLAEAAFIGKKSVPTIEHGMLAVAARDRWSFSLQPTPDEHYRHIAPLVTPTEARSTKKGEMALYDISDKWRATMRDFIDKYNSADDAPMPPSQVEIPRRESESAPLLHALPSLLQTAHDCAVVRIVACVKHNMCMASVGLLALSLEPCKSWRDTVMKRLRTEIKRSYSQTHQEIENLMTGLEDYDLTRPVYLACAFSPFVLFQNRLLTKDNANKRVSLKHTCAELARKAPAFDLARLKVEHAIFTALRRMTVEGFGVFDECIKEVIRVFEENEHLGVAAAVAAEDDPGEDRPHQRAIYRVQTAMEALAENANVYDSEDFQVSTRDGLKTLLIRKFNAPDAVEHPEVDNRREDSPELEPELPELARASVGSPSASNGKRRTPPSDEGEQAPESTQERYKRRALSGELPAAYTHKALDDAPLQRLPHNGRHHANRHLYTPDGDGFEDHETQITLYTHASSVMRKRTERFDTVAKLARDACDADELVKMVAACIWAEGMTLEDKRRLISDGKVVYTIATEEHGHLNEEKIFNLDEVLDMHEIRTVIDFSVPDEEPMERRCSIYDVLSNARERIMYCRSIDVVNDATVVQTAGLDDASTCLLGNPRDYKWKMVPTPISTLSSKFLNIYTNSAQTRFRTSPAGMCTYLTSVEGAVLVRIPDDDLPLRAGRGYQVFEPVVHFVEFLLYPGDALYIPPGKPFNEVSLGGPRNITVVQ